MPKAHHLRPALLVAAFGTLFAAGSASAQQSPYGNGPTESVIVVAPRLHADRPRLNGPLEKASLSMDVRYDDLNLLTHSGARMLRARVWQTANEVCDRLAEAYPVYELSTATPCVREAYENAMVKAYGAINRERVNYWQPY